MKNFITALALIGLSFLLIFLSAIISPCYGQEIVKEGKVFTQVLNKDKVNSKETKTEYTYKDSKGVEYPIYLSTTGKAYIKKISKKTGKEYKQYLPEIGKQINPEAYKEKK